MPRRSRVALNGVPLHIKLRAAPRRSCFIDDADYRTFLGWLGEALAANDCELHAYALMPNQVHLLLTPRKAESIAAVVMAMGRRYVQYFNRRHRRTGTLWESRYRSSLIQPETYLLDCQRFIEMRPVRAKLAKDAARYRWSSYGANALGKDDPLVSPHAVYEALGRGPAARQKKYLALFGLDADVKTSARIELALIQNQPLGNERFYAKIERLTGERREARPRGRPRLDAAQSAG
jgi:putative transposase